MQTYETHKGSPKRRCRKRWIAGLFFVRSGVGAGVAPEGNRVRGGFVSKIGGGLFPRSFCYLAAMQLLGSDRPASPCRTGGEGQDGSDPPFFAAGAARWEGGCYSRCSTAYTPLLGGRSRPF